MKSLKNIILILITFLLSSCVVLDKHSMTSTSIDLTEFDKQGIFVTTGDLFKKYETISIIAVECYNGYIPKSTSKEKSNKEDKTYYDDVYGTPGLSYDKIKNFKYQACDLNDLFSEMISQVKEKGANGIIKLEIQNISRQGENLKTIQKGIQIVGLAIRIEK